MRKIGKIIFSFLFVCCTVIGFYITDQSFGMEASAAGNPPQAPERLKVNLLDKPLGVSKDGLRFSWSFEDPDANEYQSAYRIVVASSKAQFLQKEYVYDSGWSDASASSGVEPAGLPECLTDNGLYYWAVQVRDSQGLESELSQPEMLVTSVGDQWTNKNGIWGSSSQKFVFLRNKLSLDKPVEKVIASVTAASTETTQQYVYQFYVNGQLVGLGPSVKNLSDLYYNTYDITSLLNQGENILGAVCYAEDKQGFLCQITAFYEDGTKEVLCNSGSNPSSWQALDANEIYGYQGKSIASYYHASPENLNGTKFPYGWNQAEFQGTGWKSALSSGSIEEKNQGELTPYPSGNMTRYQQPAASVTRLSDGSYVVDLGKEIIGSIRLTVDSPKQQTVTLLYGEERNNDGTVKSKMRTGNVYEEQWVLKKGEQTLEGIGMKCFRYIQIKNFPAALTAEQITGLTIRQEFDDSQSSFSSSNQMLNEIYEMTKYTVKTAAQSQYVDSQSRERKTYEGDILVQMMSSFSFLDDYSLARHSLDYVVNNPTWPAEYQLFAITAAWQEYLYSGDIAFLRDHYDQLKNALYDSSYNSNLGLVHNPGKVVMVDWPYSQRDSYEVSNTAYNTAFNAVCSAAYRDMGNIAAALGYGDDASFLKERSDVIKQNMISRLYDQNTGRFYDGLTEAGAVVNHCAQHATAFSLACGIYADQAMADRMSATIVADGTIRMSVYGSYFLLDGLYQSGSGTLARQFMSNPDTQYSSNSWAYMLKKLGATMSTEAWSPEAKGNMTFSHAWGSSPASQIVRGMFGIKPTAPGFSQFEVKVQPGGLTEGAVEIPTVKGTIPVSFRLAQDGVITARVSVPANTQAQVLLPANADGSRSVTVNGTDTQAEVQQNFVKVSLGSGTYELVYDTGTAPDPSEITIPPVVNAEAYVGGLYFWQEPVTMDGVTCGTEGRGLPLNGLRFTLSGNGISGGISSSVNLIKNGWQGWKEAGELNGNAGNGQAVQAVRLKLTGEAAQQYDLYYRVHSKTYGWLDWAKNGQIAGTIGLDKQMEAIQIRIVKKDGGAPGSTTRPFVQKSQDVLTYQTHVQSYGWQNDVGQGKISGTVGQAKRLEAIRINVHSTEGSIRYRTHVQTYGWQDWAYDGEESGTVGQAKRLEAIQIELTGGLAEKYDVYYRVHSQTYGWLGWVKNGEPAGTEGLAKRLEGIQITLVEKGGSAPGMYGGGFIKPGLGTKDGVNYKTHIESYGWQSWRSNGESSGTMGEAKRLEGICIQVQNPGAAGDIEYQTHVQTYGWQNWVKNGAVSGTQGQAKRLEAIKIRLTGALAEKYDVYYRVHAQTYGWLDWAKNGEAAGTEGLAKRLEAIEIRLVEKGGSAPGSTERPYVTPPPATVDGINYQTHVQIYGWQAWKANGAVSGTSGEAKRLESIRILLQNPGYSGSVEYQTHVQTYGWQNWVKDGAESGTSGQAKRLEGIKIRLTGELAEHYDIYYRVHVQTYGWQDWVKNGEMAGTSGEAKRLEAIEIKLVEKPKPVPPEVSESQAPSENVSTDPALESSSETESLASQSSNSVEAEIENGSLSQSQSSVESSKFTDD
ncbi:Clostridial hydrophobic W [uncultured Ruminococcus sp.]|nr:Clostridial hydrophobic W [uncultured Ruminococcus sp.]